MAYTAYCPSQCIAVLMIFALILSKLDKSTLTTLLSPAGVSTTGTGIGLVSTFLSESLASAWNEFTLMSAIVCEIPVQSLCDLECLNPTSSKPPVPSTAPFLNIGSTDKSYAAPIILFSMDGRLSVVDVAKSSSSSTSSSYGRSPEFESLPVSSWVWFDSKSMCSVFCPQNSNSSRSFL